MTTSVIENLDPRPVAVGQVRGIGALIYFADADTYARGTLLGRKLTTADTYEGVIVGTGVKTIALTPRAGRTMKAGAYVLTVGNVTAGVGPATLVDPDGISEAVTLATSGAHQFPGLGVTMTITAGGTELDDAATVTFTVVAATTVLYAPFSPTGTNGAQNPNGVLLDELVATEGGNLPARPVIEGDVNQNLLVVDGGGTVTLAVLDALRVNGIFPMKTTELGVIDNPQS